MREELGIETSLVEGGRGEFTVWVGETKVAQKDAAGFPSEQEVVVAVRQALGNS
jgi:hypothetical protein